MTLTVSPIDPPWTEVGAFSVSAAGASETPPSSPASRKLGTIGDSLRRRRTSAVATCGSNGFDSTPSMPRARERASSTGSAAPVSRTTRMSFDSSGERFTYSATA